MKKVLLFLFTALIMPCLSFAQAAAERTIDDRINSVFEPVTSAIQTVIFFTVKLTPDKKTPLSSSNLINGEPLQNEEQLIFEEGELLKLRFKKDSKGVITYDTLALGNSNILQLGDGKSVTLSAPIDIIVGENNSLSSIKKGIAIPFVLIWLIVGAVFFTIYMKFVNITAFKHSLDVVRGKYDDPDDVGEVSHFQALTAALSGTVGVGNIAGVAIAVSLGGPGATFWMIIAGLFGMTSKFVECSLGVMYRNINADGTVSGGPMYYLSKGFAEKGPNWAVAGKVLAFLFAIACIGGSFGGGNMVQINQATQQLIDVTGGEASFFYGKGWIFGAAMAGLVAVIIIGGIKSIAKVTDKIVPFMVGIYLLGAIIVLGYHFMDIPSAFGQIFAGAFSAKAMYGGLVGVLIQGFRRAAFSNEAGIGSASIAHSAVKTDEPISEGVVALLEPFIDTVVICTMTALVIVITNYGGYGAEEAFTNGEELGGISLTSAAFKSVISWFPPVLSLAVILFALSTMISWSYYGLKAWTYLFGESRIADISYKILFCFFVIVGSAMSIGAVFDFGDAMIFAMCFPNIFGLYVLLPNVRKAFNEYMGKIKSGEIKRVA